MPGISPKARRLGMAARGMTVAAAVTTATALMAAPAQAVDGPITYNGFSDPAGLQLNGSAARVRDDLRVVPAEQFRAGTVFSTTPISTRQSFESVFRFYLHGGSRPPADGLAFVIQNDPRGPRAIGGDGSAHGFSGIAPSLAVDFNLYDFFGCNCPTNEVRLVPNGAYGPSGYNDTSLVTAHPNLSLYGAPVTAWVDYQAGAHLLQVFLATGRSPAKPATPVLSATVNLRALVGARAYVGFAAATGALTANMDVLYWRVRPL